MAESQRMFRLKMKNKRFLRGAICMTCKSNLLAMPKHTNSNNIQFLALHTEKNDERVPIQFIRANSRLPPKPYNLHRSRRNIVNEQKKPEVQECNLKHFQLSFQSEELQWSPTTSCQLPFRPYIYSPFGSIMHASILSLYLMASLAHSTTLDALLCCMLLVLEKSNIFASSVKLFFKCKKKKGKLMKRRLLSVLVWPPPPATSPSPPRKEHRRHNSAERQLTLSLVEKSSFHFINTTGSGSRHFVH